MKALANGIAPWMPEHFTALGTDGYGLSESRADLRNYFEINPDYICQAALVGLLRLGRLDAGQLRKHLKGLDIDPEKANPMHR